MVPHKKQNKKVKWLPLVAGDGASILHTIGKRSFQLAHFPPPGLVTVSCFIDSYFAHLISWLVYMYLVVSWEFFMHAWTLKTGVVDKLLFINIPFMLSNSGCCCRESDERWVAWKAKNDGCSAITLGGSSCFWNTSPCCKEWWRNCRESLLAMGFLVKLRLHHPFLTIICACCT